MELLVQIAAIVYELFFLLIAWVVGAVAIKLCTLGRGRVGHLGDTSLYITDKEKRKQYREAEDRAVLRQKQYYADRTIYAGIGCMFAPIIFGGLLLLWVASP